MKTNKIKILAVTVCTLLLAIMLAVPAYAADKVDSLYINAINVSVQTGKGTIFTKDFNKTNTIESKEGNFRWVALFVAKPTSKTGIYEVVEVGENLEEGKTVTIPEGGFIYTAHMDDVATTPEAEASKTNRAATKEVKKGDMITLTGVDLKTAKITADAKILLKEAAVDTSVTAGDSSVVADSSAEPTVSSEGAVSDTSFENTSSVVSAVSATSSDTSVDTSSVESEVSDGLTGTQIALIAAGVVILIAAVSFGIVKARKK